MNWTDERVKLLKKLWEKGVSASQIAVQLGGVSRNAVIGKVHRLKIARPDKITNGKPDEGDMVTQSAPVDEASLRGQKSPEKHDKIDIAKMKVTEKKLEAPSSSVFSTKTSANDDLTKEREVEKKAKVETAEAPKPEAVPSQHANNNDDELSDSDVVVPIARRLSLLQLTENTCKWPIGDPLGADFYFCGTKTCEGSPYCSYHSKIAFQPIAERRRIRI